jgi:hypothetical protein
MFPGTSGASYPFWSPNSRCVGFFADGHLKYVDTTRRLSDDLNIPSRHGTGSQAHGGGPAIAQRRCQSQRSTSSFFRPVSLLLTSLFFQFAVSLDGRFLINSLPTEPPRSVNPAHEYPKQSAVRHAIPEDWYDGVPMVGNPEVTPQQDERAADRQSVDPRRL